MLELVLDTKLIWRFSEEMLQYLGRAVLSNCTCHLDLLIQATIKKYMIKKMIICLNIVLSDLVIESLLCSGCFLVQIFSENFGHLNYTTQYSYLQTVFLLSLNKLLVHTLYDLVRFYLLNPENNFASKL